MPYLLLGPNDYSKHEFVQALLSKSGAQLVCFRVGDEIPGLGDVLQSDLFSKPKVFLFDGVMPDFLFSMPKASVGPNRVVVMMKSLDKRKKENKELLENKDIEVKEFLLPHGRELDEWIINKVEELGGQISSKAANELAVRLGRDNAKETKVGGKVISSEEVYNLFLVESEIKKLLAYAGSEEVSEMAIKELVSESGEVEVFDLTNAIGEGKKQETVALMHKFLKEQVASDEKTSVIQLNALLSEQFRNVYMIQNFLEDKISEADILEKTGWKSGRLFVVKKMASRFPSKKIAETLNKLEALDLELKTSQTPPKVLLDLIITQLF